MSTASEIDSRSRMLGHEPQRKRKVCCPDAPCCLERPCLHLAFLTSREATVLRACLIRASNAIQPHRRREVLGVSRSCLICSVAELKGTNTSIRPLSWLFGVVRHHRLWPSPSPPLPHRTLPGPGSLDRKSTRLNSS